MIYLYAHYAFMTRLLNDSIPWHPSSVHDQFVMTVYNFTFPSNIAVEARLGFHLIVHPPDELPSDLSIHFHQFLSHSTILVSPHQTFISDELKKLSTLRRNCYVEKERNLELFKTYTKQNCEHECQSFAFSKNCGCVPFYFISEFF